MWFKTFNGEKMKINLIGDFFNYTGYAIHTRNLANALNEIGCEVFLSTNKPPQWERGVNDAEYNMLTKSFMPEGTTIMISQPQFWPFGISKKSEKFFGYCVWEGDCIPEYWVKYLEDERVDKIIVPSRHTHQAIMNTLARINYYSIPSIDEKIVIIPHGVDPTKFHEAKIVHDKFTFIANKGWSQGLYDRGGIQWLLKAFAQEFKKEELVDLKIKINPVYNDPTWDLKKEIDKLELKNVFDVPVKTKDNLEGRRIYFCTDLLEESALCDFYNAGDVFITTSMAEAFNLPCIEAMACGLPVIATIYGGQTDYVDYDNGWIIEEGEYVKWSKELMYEETKWFKPDIADIRKTMRHVYMNQQCVDKKRNLALEKASQYTWNHVAKMICNLL